MEIFGDLERLIDDVYPYRWLVAALMAVIAVVFVTVAYRYGWHSVLWRRKRLTALVSIPLLVVAIPLSYYLLSPLWTRTTVVEESPLTAAARTNSVPGVPAATTPSTPPSSSMLDRQPTTTATPLAPVVTPTTDANVPIPTIVPTQDIVIQPTTEPAPEPSPESEPEPTLEPAPAPAIEPTPEPFSPRLLSSGQLSGADEFHFAEGTVQLIETEPGIYVLRLESFSVRNGPDLFVYLTRSPDQIDDLAINLGDLRATDGSINYDVPPGTDVSLYEGVVIWCRAFAVFFGSAPLVAL